MLRIQKVSGSLNYDSPLGTTDSFSYDGKELSLKIEKKVFNNVSTSAGLGFRPNGETCFYVSLDDGVEIGTIKIEGTGNFYGNSLKVHDPQCGNENQRTYAFAA